MDPSGTQKRTLKEEVNSLHEASPASLGDHQPKRPRLTLPPINTSPSPNSGLYQLPLPGPPPASLTPVVSLPQFSPPIDSLPPVLPARLTLPAHTHIMQELPPIDSLGPLSIPPPPAPQYNSNPMSVSAILINTEEDQYDNLRSIDRSNQTLNNDNFAQSPLLSSLAPTSPEISQMIFGVNSEENDDESIASITNGYHQQQQDNSIDEDNPRRPQLIVHNDDSLNMEGIEERRLGYIVYNPKEILPPLEFLENGLLEVWIPSQHLTWENSKVRKRWLWGTDVYTDDSDPVAALIHTGYFIPKQSRSQWASNYPDHDLCVTIRVLPKLVQYTSCLRHRLKSRSWGNHDGVSFKIENIRKMKEGEATGRARGEGRKQRLKRFHRLRKLAFGEAENNKCDTIEQNAILGFNIDGDPCYKYSPQLMSNQENIQKQLRKEVMFLENDEERYEISYDDKKDKYRIAVVLPSVHLGKRAPIVSQNGTSSTSVLPYLPLEKSNLEEILRDDLTFQDMEWNIVGVIIKDHVNTTQSLLIVLKRVYWRNRNDEVTSSR